MYKIHNWYLSENKYGLIAHGNVTGHYKFPDSMFIHTSPIQDISVDGSTINFITLNSVYQCEAKEFSKQIVDIQELAENGYKDILNPVIELLMNTSFIEIPIEAHNEIIMFLGNTREYYFDKVVIDCNGEYSIEKEMYPHIGTFQDSVICDYWVGEECVDLRYFPYQGNRLQFYCVDKPEIKLSIENIGNDMLTVGIKGKVYKLKPGERQEIVDKKPNEKSEDVDGTDLYPAVYIDELKIYEKESES